MKKKTKSPPSYLGDTLDPKQLNQQKLAPIPQLAIDEKINEQRK